jgi:hypothetical protein
MQAIVVPGLSQDLNQQSMRLALFDEEGQPLDISGGGSGPPPEPGWNGMLDWQPYPLANGWQNYPDVFPADNFGYPCFAVYGEVVWLRGALYRADDGGGGHLGALPDAAKPFHKQRMNLNQAQGFLSLDIRPNGLLVNGSGNPPPNGHIILSGHYYLTETLNPSSPS